MPISPPPITAPVLQRPAQRTLVKAKRNWSDPWVLAPYLHALSCTETAVPTVSKATLRYDAGAILREGAAAFAVSPAYDFKDFFVRVEKVPDPGGGPGATAGLLSGGGSAAAQPRVLFTGVVGDDAFMPAGADVPEGAEQQMTAYGLEYLLDRRDVRISWVSKGPGTGEAFEIDRVLVFNERYRRGFTERGNRGLERVTRMAEGGGGGPIATSWVFDRYRGTTDAADPQLWSVYDVLEYLLENFGNATAGPPAGLKWRVGGDKATLECLKKFVLPRFDAGACRSPWDAVCKLIDRRRGLAATVRVGAGGYASGVAAPPGSQSAEVAELFVFTGTREPIVLDDATVPANPNQAQIDLAAFAHHIDRVTVRADANIRYGRVEAIGEPMVSCCTLSFAGGELEPGWTPAEQTAYNAATGAPAGGTVDEDRADNERAGPRHRHVYQHFLVKRDWPFRTTSGAPAAGGGPQAAGKGVIPWIDPLGKLDQAKTDAGGFSVRSWGHHLLRTIPVLKSERKRDDGTAEPEYREMFAVISKASPKALPVGDAAAVAENSTTFVALEAFADCRAHARPLDTEFGLAVQTTPNHLMALGTFDPTAGKSKKQPKLDYRQLRVTAAFETDRRLKAYVDVPGGDPSRVLSVYVPGATLWYVAPGTIVDVKDGQPVAAKAYPPPKFPGDPAAAPAAGEVRAGVVRDDSPRLRQVLDLARAWYGLPRQPLSFRLAYLAPEYPVGTFVTRAYDASNDEPVNGCVTQKVYDCADGTTAYETSFGELDVTLGGRPSRQGALK